MPDLKEMIKKPVRRLIPEPARVLLWTPVRKAKQRKQAERSLAPERLTGTLARDGGMPVRDVNVRPWAAYPFGTKEAWKEKVEPMMKRMFLTGQEGLPQNTANEFARRWAEHCGVRHALLLPHGTDALRIALAAALDHDGLDYGGEVIVPNLSFIASSTSALDRRLGVALVDVDPGTLLLDPAKVEAAIIPGKTRAIMAVHLFGQPCDMRALRDIAARHSLKIIEDAAQAHGGIHMLGRAGALGDAAGFSFQAFKNLSSGEGGAFTTNDAEIFERAYAFHNVGRARIGGQRWAHENLGWNCRATEYIAAVLLHRLENLEEQQQHRHARFHKLRRELNGISCVLPLELGADTERHGVHMFVMRYQPQECGGLSIDDFITAMKAEGIPVMQLYNAMTQAQQPLIQKIADKHPEYVRVLSTPVADQAVKEILWLPHDIFLGSDADMTEIALAFAKVQAHYAPHAIKRRREEQSTSDKQEAVVPARTQQPEVLSVASLTTRPLRFGIIGIGVMGRNHAAAIKLNPAVTLVAVTDANNEAGSRAAADLECKSFASAEELIESGEIDAVVIATPHWQHAELAIPALRAGLHVVCEKPLAVTIEEADELIKVAANSPAKFAVVFQNRFEPAYRYARQLLTSGELGEVYRCSIVESAWRTKAYYDSAAWRGTWKGEGGGVLINQAPHVLDRYAWLCGMPESVTARCDTNLHDIEVEDTASILLRHANGAHGYIHVSTVEAPPISRTTVACDRGRVVIDGGRIFVTKLRASIRERTFTDSGMGGNLGGETREIFLSQVAAIPQLLNAFYDNFAAAVAGREPLVCPGEEGLYAVELANATILSSVRGVPITLPLDRGEYTRWIENKLNPELAGVLIGKERGDAYAADRR